MTLQEFYKTPCEDVAAMFLGWAYDKKSPERELKNINIYTSRVYVNNCEYYVYKSDNMCLIYTKDVNRTEPFVELTEQFIKEVTND